MRLNWRHSSRSQDRLEKTIAQQHEKRVLAGDVVPVGPCPDEDFLRMLARRSSRIALTDSRVDHAASCPVCMERLISLRWDYRRRRRIWIIACIAFICLVLATMIAIVTHHDFRWHRE